MYYYFGRFSCFSKFLKYKIRILSRISYATNSSKMRMLENNMSRKLQRSTKRFVYLSLFRLQLLLWGLTSICLLSIRLRMTPVLYTARAVGRNNSHRQPSFHKQTADNIQMLSKDVQMVCSLAQAGKIENTSLV